MNKAKPIYNTFLKDLDKFLGKNLGNLTCADIREMYFDFYWELKNFKGNSSGFTGLSEYIIFRLIYNLLGGSFEKRAISQWLYEFVSTDKIYRIGQNTPITAGNQKFYPDIIVYKNDNPFLVIEIKIYLTYGIKTLMGDIDKLNVINSMYPNSKGLFIIYDDISKGKAFERLKREIKLNNNLNYIILEGNSRLFKKEIDNYL